MAECLYDTARATWSSTQYYPQKADSNEEYLQKREMSLPVIFRWVELTIFRKSTCLQPSTNNQPVEWSCCGRRNNGVNNILWFGNLPCCYIHTNNFVCLRGVISTIKCSTNYIEEVYGMQRVKKIVHMFLLVFVPRIFAADPSSYIDEVILLQLPHGHKFSKCIFSSLHRYEFDLSLNFSIYNIRWLFLAFQFFEIDPKYLAFHWLVVRQNLWCSIRPFSNIESTNCR